MKRLFLFAVLFMAGFNLAQAHAFLAQAEPKVGSTAEGSPSVVKIWFTMEVQPARSDIEVFETGGKEIDRKDVKVDATDKALMSVSVPSLAPGTYRVVWHAVCPFGHHTSGTFSFQVTAR